MVNVSTLIDFLNESIESQGLDQHHWKRKDSFKITLNEILKFKPAKRRIEVLNSSLGRDMIQYLARDGEDITLYVKKGYKQSNTGL